MSAAKVKRPSKSPSAPQFVHIINMLSNHLYLFYPATLESYRLDFHLDNWTQINVSTTLGDTVYIIGDQTPTPRMCSITITDPADHSVRSPIPRAHLLFPRSIPTLVPCGSSIYAVGGLSDYKHNTGFVSYCERYDSAEDRWTLIPPLENITVRISGCAMCGFIYVVGADNNTTQVWFERLDTLDESAGWKTIIKLNMGNAELNFCDSICQVGCHDVMLFCRSSFDTVLACFVVNVGQNAATTMKSRIIFGDTRREAFFGVNSPIVLNGNIYAADMGEHIVHVLGLKFPRDTIVQLE